jgi:SAM-dependent methyltransferase
VVVEVVTTGELGNAAATFDPFAAHYDAFTDHPAYADWIRRLEELARRHGLSGNRALDIGCGTGKSILPLLELGYQVVGCDPSGHMLAECRRKVGGQARLIHAPAEALPELGRFDYITSLNDVCNYIVDRRDLVAAFVAIAANLADDGLLLFDANTPTTYRGFFAETHWRESSSVKMVWHGPSADSFTPNGPVEAAVEIFSADAESGLWRHQTSRHVQRHYDENTLADVLQEAGLRATAVYGQTDAGPPEQPLQAGHHTKAIYIAEKGAPHTA